MKNKIYFNNLNDNSSRTSSDKSRLEAQDVTKFKIYESHPTKKVIISPTNPLEGLVKNLNEVNPELAEQILSLSKEKEEEMRKDRRAESRAEFFIGGIVVVGGAIFSYVIGSYEMLVYIIGTVIPLLFARFVLRAYSKVGKQKKKRKC